jgi:hypothetical protein
VYTLNFSNLLVMQSTKLEVKSAIYFPFARIKNTLLFFFVYKIKKYKSHFAIKAIMPRVLFVKSRTLITTRKIQERIVIKCS